MVNDSIMNNEWRLFSSTYIILIELFFLTFQDEGWKLNRAHYYQEGWLSTANLRGVVGVTYTTSHCAGAGLPPAGDGSELDLPSRTNYNLRGHRSEVSHLKRGKACDSICG